MRQLIGFYQFSVVILLFFPFVTNAKDSSGDNSVNHATFPTTARQLFHEAKNPTLSGPPSAAEKKWLAREGAKRAAQYIRASERIATNNLRAREAELEQTGNQELLDFQNKRRLFYGQNLAVQQVMGALDLSASQSIQMDAAKVMLALADMDPGEQNFEMLMEHAMTLAAAACRSRKRGKGRGQFQKRMAALLDWIDDPNGVLLNESPAPRTEILDKFSERISSWAHGASPPNFPTSYKYSNISNDAMTTSSDTTTAKIAASFTDQVLFPTHVMTTNVLSMLPTGFCERLAKLAMRKYKTFASESAAQNPQGFSPGQLNDKFFDAQHKSVADLRHDTELHAWWPELYSESQDFEMLIQVMRGSLVELAARHDLIPPPQSGNQYNADMYDVTLWAAVYPSDHSGARHGNHVHQGSLASCVLYVQTLDTPLPIAFVDPRGGKPTDDWDKGGETDPHYPDHSPDTEPTAPFHRKKYFFPKKGDLVCFPSWLVHHVPMVTGSGKDSSARVAFAANLESFRNIDVWLRTTAA